MKLKEEEEEEEEEVCFSASSPDEQALVSAAKFFGFSFESRGIGIARVRIFNKAMLFDSTKENEVWEFKILDVLEFNSERKRMSIIVQFPNNGDLFLFTKGADNILLPLLCTKNQKQIDKTFEHLDIFGQDGLRTLTIAKKKLNFKEYLIWNEKYKKALSNLDEIEKKKQQKPNQIDQLMEEMEQNLILLGATAIEDKLQKNVPRTISNLRKSGMKIWILTGDKQETAINIAYACQLMDNDMDQFVLNCELYPTKQLLCNQLETIVQALTIQKNTQKAIVIDGECLEKTLENITTSELFIKIALKCDAVVCCRVSPSQKAEVVALVRGKNKKARTLSIGDGANDVAMIQKAHVGVGICGQEGLQAVNSSDYAIGQFEYLEKLLLHHGRLNYKRMSVVVGYMFYKNIIMVLGQYYYMYLTGVSGQKFYSEFVFQLYNICYTSLPIIVLGVFDLDLPWVFSQKFPQLYLVGPRMELFNDVIFFKWIASAIFEALVIFFFCIWGYNPKENAIGSGAMVQYGLITFTLVVLIANLKLCMIQMSWFIYGGILWWIGILSYIPVSIYLSSNLIRFFSVDYGSFQNTLNGPSFWLVLPITCVAALLRQFVWTSAQRRFYPLPWQIVQEQYVLGLNTAGEVILTNDSPLSPVGDEHSAQNPISMENGSVPADIELQFIAEKTSSIEGNSQMMPPVRKCRVVYHR
jgi:phospholipid-translocating P-type ATPase (flippase)